MFHELYNGDYWDYAFYALYQLEYLYHDFLSYTIIFVLTIALILIRKEKLRSYGFTVQKWKSNLQLGFLVSFFTILPIIIPIAIGWNSIIEIPNPYFLHFSLIYYIIFVAFSEELLFRGYIQTRLNHYFGLFETRYSEIKWGTIITAFLFAGVHTVRYFNPFTGQFQFLIILGWFPITFSFGLLAGILREKTGSLLAPILIHGILDVFIFINDDYSVLNQSVIIVIWIFIIVIYLKNIIETYLKNALLREDTEENIPNLSKSTID